MVTGAKTGIRHLFSYFHPPFLWDIAKFQEHSSSLGRAGQFLLFSKKRVPNPFGIKIKGAFVRGEAVSMIERKFFVIFCFAHSSVVW